VNLTAERPAILVLYATREGHTRRVAEHVAQALRRAGAHASAASVTDPAVRFDPFALQGVILAAPVHAGRFEREMVRFVRSRRADLDRLPNAFLPVSLSQAGVQRGAATPEEHARFAADVRKLDERFFGVTGWTPKQVERVAGALLYTRYNWVIRLVMRRIARQSGGSTDTSRDHDYTDWTALDAFAGRFVAGIRGGAGEATVAERAGS
jgi:menaquinone-dependent protoporphyrinogen oxidase